MFENAEVIKEGIWRYNNSIECNIRIIKWHTLYGTGDYEDPSQSSDDKEVDCYYVLQESILDKGKFPTSRGGFLTVQEAVEDAENCMLHKVEWVK